MTDSVPHDWTEMEKLTGQLLSQGVLKIRAIQCIIISSHNSHVVGEVFFHDGNIEWSNSLTDSYTPI